VNRGGDFVGQGERDSSGGKRAYGLSCTECKIDISGVDPFLLVKMDWLPKHQGN